MTPLENAVEVAAKGTWDDVRETTGQGTPWEELGPIDQHGIKSILLPAVQALHDAGLLTDETTLRNQIAAELETYATTQPGQGFGVYHNAAKTIRNPK